MSNLLSAGFMRVRKDKVFTVVFLSVLIFSLRNCFTTISNWPWILAEFPTRRLDDCFFGPAPYYCFLCGILRAVYITPEYSFGTMRNKISVGHSRKDIYLSEYIICLAVSLAFAAVYVVCMIPTILVIGLEMSRVKFFGKLLVIAGFTASFTALILFVNMNFTFRNAGLSVFLTLAVCVVMTVMATIPYDRLSIPETVSGLVLIDGRPVITQPEPNPSYVTGVKRQIFGLMLEILPVGQAVCVAFDRRINTARVLAFSLILTTLLLCLGIRLFKNKDIK